MDIDDKDAEQIARSLLCEIAFGWEDTPAIRCLKENDAYIFEYTLQPSAIYRYAHLVKRPTSPSVFRFNPLAEATEIVISAAETLNPDLANDARIAQIAIPNIARSRIMQMLISAPDVFTDAMWQARIIGETIPSVIGMQARGRPDIARGLINSAMAMIEKKIREYFGEIRQKQKPKISQWSIEVALWEFASIFKETGQIPSQRRFAKALGVTPKGWRDHLDNNKLGDHDSFIRRCFEQMFPPEPTPRK
jgi:hypothetical protein